MNRGVEIDLEVADDFDRSVIREQVEMGVAVRMACLECWLPPRRAERNASDRSRGPRGGDAAAMNDGHEPGKSGRARPEWPISTPVMLDPPGGARSGRRPDQRRREIADFGPHLTARARRRAPRLSSATATASPPGWSTSASNCASRARNTRRRWHRRAGAATAGGITSMVCLPNTRPVIDDMSADRVRRPPRPPARPDQGVRLRRGDQGAGRRRAGRDGHARRGGAVAFTDGVNAVASAQVMRQALCYAQTFGLLIVSTPEEPTLAAGGAMNTGEMATRLGLAGIPREAEVIMVERDIRLVRDDRGRLHFAPFDRRSHRRSSARRRRAGSRSPATPRRPTSP